MLASCASRLAIPDIVGTVYDAKHLKPIANAAVYIDADNNAKTDAQGHFHLKKKRYAGKISVGGETSPVIYNLKVSKKEYKDTTIHYKNLFGGGNKKLTVKYDTILLQRQ